MCDLHGHLLLGSEPGEIGKIARASQGSWLRRFSLLLKSGEDLRGELAVRRGPVAEGDVGVLRLVSGLGRRSQIVSAQQLSYAW